MRRPDSSRAMSSRLRITRCWRCTASSMTPSVLATGPRQASPSCSRRISSCIACLATGVLSSWETSRTSPSFIWSSARSSMFWRSRSSLALRSASAESTSSVMSRTSLSPATTLPAASRSGEETSSMCSVRPPWATVVTCRCTCPSRNVCSTGHPGQTWSSPSYAWWQSSPTWSPKSRRLTSFW